MISGSSEFCMLLIVFTVIRPISWHVCITRQQRMLCSSYDFEMGVVIRLLVLTAEYAMHIQCQCYKILVLWLLIAYLDCCFVAHNINLCKTLHYR